MSLGRRLKEERELKNWTQKYVAEKIGISNTVLSNYERDYRDPDTDTLAKLTSLYDISTDYILGKTDIRNSNSEQNQFTQEELNILIELKKYPELYYNLASNPEKNVKLLVSALDLKKLLISKLDEE